MVNGWLRDDEASLAAWCEMLIGYSQLRFLPNRPPGLIATRSAFAA